MIEIKELDKKYSGKEFIVQYKIKGYYDIQLKDLGFDIQYKLFDKPKERSFKDTFYSEWLEDPKAFGVFENENLLGFVEGNLETWNNRYRITNICLFYESRRHQGIGQMLIQTIIKEAIQHKVRMIVLETQSCNENAIAFYQKYGFKIIGFDLYAYSNTDVENHEIRIEMGKILD